MINKEAYQIFNDYVKDYDITNPKVELKVKHTYSVVKKVEQLPRVCCSMIRKSI